MLSISSLSGAGLFRFSLLFALCSFLFSLFSPLSAQEGSASLEATQLNILKFGTETEIANLIETLTAEGIDTFDNEIIALVENTRNIRILAGAFSFFGEKGKSGLEDRAIRAIEERNEEKNETVTAAIDYLGKVKAVSAVSVLQKLLNSGERRFFDSAFRAYGRVCSALPSAPTTASSVSPPPSASVDTADTDAPNIKDALEKVVRTIADATVAVVTDTADTIAADDKEVIADTADAIAIEDTDAIADATDTIDTEDIDTIAAEDEDAEALADAADTGATNAMVAAMDTMASDTTKVFAEAAKAIAEAAKAIAEAAKAMVTDTADAIAAGTVATDAVDAIDADETDAIDTDDTDAVDTDIADAIDTDDTDAVAADDTDAITVATIVADTAESIADIAKTNIAETANVIVPNVAPRNTAATRSATGTRSTVSARTAAIRNNTAQNTTDAADYLIDYYRNRDPGDENRRELITAMGAIGSPQAIEFLSGIAVNSDERFPLRMAAIESIAKINEASPDSGGLDAVLAGITAADTNVRATAVSSLGPFSGPDVDKAILDAFRDSNYRARSAAAQASGKRKMTSAVSYLKFRAERDEVPAVKDDAIRALGEIADSESIAILEELFTERKNSDRVRLVAGEMLMKDQPERFLGSFIVELDEAKQKNQTPLYNGLLKIIGNTKCANMESITRRLMETNGVVEKSYALDMAVNNQLTSLAPEIRTIADGKHESLAAKARRTMEKLGL